MERTCLVTKTKASPAKLLRFTVVEGQLVFDEKHKAPGRGGYVLKSAEAIAKLPKLAGKIAYFLKAKKVEVNEAELERGKTMLH